MNIQVEIMGPAKRKLPDNPANVEIPDNSSVLDLMKLIGYNKQEAGFFVYVLKDRHVTLNTPLSDGDFLKVVLQVGGG